MRNATEIERKVIEKQVSNYLWMENLQTFMGVLVCLVISVGLFFANSIDNSIFISSVVASTVFAFLFVLYHNLSDSATVISNRGLKTSE